MVNAQEWLDENYPKEKRQEIERLVISYRNLEGNLNIENFPNLHTLDSNGNQLTSIDFDLESCKKIKTFGFRWNKLKEVNLSNFSKLEELYASDNQLEILNLNNCKNIRDIYCRSNNLIGLNLPSFCTNLTNLNCSNNFLTDISFLNKIANPKKIISLSLGSNNFSHDNMGINIRTFSRFTNLTSLSIGNNNKEKLKRDVKNKFVGSLRAFSGMVGLNEIYLPNADVETDLENLPSSLKIIECNGSLMEKLKDFLTENLETKEKKDYSSFRCDYEKWREENKNLIVSNESKPKLEKKLGEGSFAEVYQGTHKGNPVAIKKSKVSVSQISVKELERFQQEVENLKKLNNPYIVLYIDMFDDDQYLMIITELAQYGTLTDYINQNKNQGHDWEINYDFIRQITLGLTYLHKSKVVHRDLKSPNILICEGAIAKIADFGLSKEIDDLTISKTASKGILGTPRWMAPEVLKSEKYSFASDIYSLGMVIWEIVAQETVPFRQFNNNNTVMFNVGSGLKETVPIDSPKALKEIIEKCWKTKPEERISLAEIKSKIEETSIIKERVGSDDEFYDANESFSETGNQEELIEQFAQIQIPS